MVHRTYLALDSGQESGDLLIVGLDVDGVEELLDVISTRGGDTTEDSEQISSEVLHFLQDEES